MNPNPLVTFDLWETLICEPEGAGAHRREARLDLFRHALDRLGWRVHPDALVVAYDGSWTAAREVWERQVDVDIPEQVRNWLARLDNGQPELSEDQWAELERLYVKPFLDLRANLLPGARETVLAARQAGFTVGMISNTGRTPGWALRECMRDFDLLDLFAFTLFSNEEMIRKPHPDIFRRAAGHAGVETAIHVGDNYALDVKGAQAVGWRTIWITPEPAPTPDVATDIWPDIRAGAQWFANFNRAVRPTGRD